MKQIFTNILMETINKFVKIVRIIVVVSTNYIPCVVCDMIIRKRNRKKHEESHKHMMNYFWNTHFDSSRLQLQNRRVS
jgi:hypothetical protein